MGLVDKPPRPSLVDGAEQAVRSWLVPGRYRQGDRLPPEHELASMLGISRGTLRSALHRLELGGEIVRRQGSGTFVGRLESPMANGQQPRLESYSTHTRAPGSRLAVSQLRINDGLAGHQAAKALAIGARDQAVVITRTLVVRGTPAAVTRDVFHPGVALPDGPRLRQMLCDGLKMIDVLASTGVTISYSRTTISAVLISTLDAVGRRLKLTDPTACLKLEEIVHAGGGTPILYSRDVYSPDGVELEVMQSLDAPTPDRVSSPFNESSRGAVSRGATVGNGTPRRGLG